MGDVQKIGLDIVGNWNEAARGAEKTAEAVDNLEGSLGSAIGVADELGASLAGVGAEGSAAAGGIGELSDATKALLAANPAMAAKLAELTGGIAGVGDAAATTTPEVVALTEAVDGETVAAERAAAAVEMLQKAEEQRSLQMASSIVSQRAAEAQLGSFYKTYSKLESLGTPAFMKGATYLGLGAVGAIYEGVKMYADLGAKMTQLSTQAGVDKNLLPGLTQDALRISKETGQSVNDIADAMYRVASGTASWRNGLGATKQQLAQITESVSQLNLLGNVPGGQQAEQASRILTVLLNANFKGIGKDPKKAMALINAGVGAGDIRMSELISALGRGALASASGVGLSAKDAISWIDLLTSMGTTGSVAGTYVRSGIINLAAAGGKGEKALAMLGIKPGQIQALMSGPTGLIGAAQFLNEHLNKFNPVLTYPKFHGLTGRAGAEAQLEAWGANSIDPKLIAKWGLNSMGAIATDMAKQTLTPQEKQFLKIFMLANSFGGAKQLTPILTLLQATNLPGQPATRTDTIQGIEANITRNATQQHLNESIEQAKQTPKTQFNILLRTLQADLINIGKALTPLALSITKGITNVVTALSKMKPVLEILGVALGGLLITAGAIKTAGFIKSLYAPLGKLYGVTDKVWGLTSKVPGLGWTKRLAGGGERFRQAAAMSDKMTLKAAGDILAKAGIGLEEAAMALKGAAGAEVRAAEVSSLGGGGGGGGSTEQKIESKIKSKIWGRIKSRLFKKGEQELLSRAEGAVESRVEGVASREVFERLGGVVAKPSILRLPLPQGVVARESGLLVPELEHGVERRASGLLVKEAEHTVEKTVVKDTIEKVGENVAAKVGTRLAGGAFMEGASDMIGGVLGGPIGMAAMSALAPIAIPYIMRGLGAVGGFVGSLFSGPKAPTVTGPAAIGTRQAAIQAHLNQQQKQLMKDEAALAHAMATGGDTSKIMKWIARDQRNISGLGRNMNDVNNLSDFKKIYNQTNALERVKSNIKNHKNISLQDAVALPYAVSKQLFGKDAADLIRSTNGKMPRGQMRYRILQSLMFSRNGSGNGAWTGTNAKYVGDEFKAYQKYMLSSSASGYLSQVDKNYIKNYNLQQQRLAATNLIKNDVLNASPRWRKNQDYAWASGRWSRDSNVAKGQIFKAEQEALRFSSTANRFTSLANASTDPNTKAAYLAEARKLSAAAQALQSSVGKEGAKLSLNKDDIISLATAIANAQKSMYTSLGLTKQGYIDAFSAAISANGQGLAAIVNKANATATAYK